jgi:hypothetical protein
MFAYDPAATLRAVSAPVMALNAGDDPGGDRERALAVVDAVRTAAGRPPIRVEPFRRDGHNLMRYRPDAVSSAILSITEPTR